MIAILSGFPEGVIACRVTGTITRKDYEAKVIPAVESALARHDKLRVYCEAESEVSAEAGAMWDDFKLGVSHWTSWERISIVTDALWLARTVRLMSFLLPGQLLTFSSSERQAARDWIVEGL